MALSRRAARLPAGRRRFVGVALSAALWPCWRCGATSSRAVGTRGYCSTHLAELLATFDPAVFALGGSGLPCGAQRPELGPAVEDLRCVACGATWAGLAGELCAWCVRSRQALLDHERDLLLRLPDELDDERVVLAWGDRLRRAVDVGLVTKPEAERVWRRAVVRHAR